MTRKILLTCLGALVALGAQAQALELGLNEAIEIALDENPTIKVAGMEIERQRLVKNETVGNFLPSLSAEGIYTRAVEPTRMMGLPVGPENIVQGTGTIGLPLLVPALFQTLKLNDEQMRAAVEAARASKLSLVNEVKKSYYGVLMAEEALAVLKSSEETMAETVRETRSRFENEMASEYDLVTAEVQLSNLQPSIYQAQNALESAWKMFRMLLGLPQDVEVGLKENLEELVRSSSTEAIVRDGLEENSDLRAMDIQHSIMKRQLGIMRTQRLPSLTAFGTINLTGQDQITNFGEIMMGAPKKTEFQWEHPINVGARLSIPIFTGFTNVSKERQLKNQIRQLELQRDYAEEGMRVQADNAQANVGTAFSKMLAGRNTITQAQKGYYISKVRFEEGMGTILELNSAELALTQSRMNYTQAVYDYLSAQADYEKIIGREPVQGN